MVAAPIFLFVLVARFVHRMTGTREKRCKECGASGQVNKEEKCGNCEAVEADDTCPTCEVVVGEGEKGLQCDDCQQWYHAQCEGIDGAWYRKMQKVEIWFCRKCKCSLKRQAEMVRRLKEERDRLKAEQRRYDEQIKELMESLGAVERENRDLREEIKALKEKKLSKGQEEVEPDTGKQSPRDHTYSGKVKKARGEGSAVEVTDSVMEVTVGGEGPVVEGAVVVKGCLR